MEPEAGAASLAYGSAATIIYLGMHGIVCWSGSAVCSGMTRSCFDRRYVDVVGPAGHAYRTRAHRRCLRPILR